MKAIIQLLLIAFTSLVLLPLNAQVNCAAKFSKNFKIQDKQTTETKPLVILSTFEYEYEVFFLITEEGVFLTMTTTDIHQLEKGETKIQFITEDDEKITLDFINENKKTTLRS